MAQRLNHLTGKEWILFSKSWFTLSGKTNKPKTNLHPATFPIELAQSFIQFFTREGEHMLDPFAGTGTTLQAAEATKRRGTGIELNQDYVQFAQERSPQGIIHQGDAHALIQDPQLFPDGSVDYLFTSPPYGNMLHTSRDGNPDTRHKQRQQENRALTYSNDQRDLGNLPNDQAYIQALMEILNHAHRVLAPQRYMTIIIQNMNHQGALRPIA